MIDTLDLTFQLNGEEGIYEALIRNAGSFSGRMCACVCVCECVCVSVCLGVCVCV